MRSLFLTVTVAFAALMVVLMPLSVNAEKDEVTMANPPISQPLVREGTFAVKLAEALHIGNPYGELEAENLLASEGVIPRNGWIADYPVTPDIVDELQEAVRDAAASGTLTLGKDDALDAFYGVLYEYQLSVAADTSGQTGDDSAGKYPDTTTINNYYYDEGPPVVTYYAPPPPYAYLYSWVPYPFWWWDSWFPGFFVLVDFDRVVLVDHHHRVISNRFVDPVTQTFYRLDPPNRRHGGMATGAEGRVVNPYVVGPSGVSNGADRILRGNPVGTALENRTTVSPSGNRRGGLVDGNGATVPPASRGRIYSAPARQEAVSPPSGGGGVYNVPAGRRAEAYSGGGRAASQPDYGISRSYSQPSGSTRVSNAPSSGSGRMSSAPSGDRSLGSFFGGGSLGGGFRR